MLSKKALNTLLGCTVIIGLAGCGGGGGAGSSGLSSIDKPATATKTAQGIWAEFLDTDTYAESGTALYKLDKSLAALAFSNILSSGPSISCTGSPTNCALANQPAAPSAPAPDASKAQDLAWNQRCILLDGGNLTGGTYTQDVTLGGKNGKGSFTFTFSYSISPVSNPVAAKTGWVLFKDNGVNPDATANVSVQARLAGESVIQSSKWPHKFSYSLKNEDGTPRIADLALSVGGSPLATVPGVTVLENCPGCMPGDSGAVDFNFTANAGTNGYTPLLSNGDARTILNTDDFAGNDNGGADGAALAMALTDSVDVSLPIGDTDVTLTGSVKNVDFSITSTFTVHRTVHIVYEGCSNAP